MIVAMEIPGAAFDEICRRYALDPDVVEAIGSFDNDLYRAERGGVGTILRISGPAGRPTEQIRAEVAWIDHLAAGGVPCARAIPSDRGEPVEVVALSAGGALTAALFAQAPGHPSDDDEIDEAFVRAWGATLGRIHALGRDVRPSDPSWIRPDWRSDARSMEALFPASEGVALARYRETVKRLEALPTEPDVFGLIHGDAHRGNFFVHRGAPFLFDFYDCLYSWFVNELAIALFYAVMDAPESGDRSAWATWFFRHLLAGYRSEHPLDGRWLAAVPDLLKLREIDTYALTLHHQGESYHDDPWSARYMLDRRERIEAGVPYLALDWDEIASDLS
jgi:Ser/Thr protein kinase RdoA (MazF antagonist)